MKRSIVSVITALSVLLTVMTMASCDLLSPKEDEPTKQPDSPYGPETPDGPAYGPETPDGPALYEKALWGEWVRMDTGEKWYISSSFIKVDAYELFQMPVLNKQSDKVIEVSDSGRKYYLYASRVANTSFTGKIASFDAPSSRSLGGIGGIGISITNLNNMANEVSATTDTNGNFTVEGIIPGDAYTITPEGGTPTTVMPQGDGDDVGTITIVSGGVNFKTTINSSATYRAGTSNSISITVTNTGDEDCTAATFELAFGDGLSGTTSGILGTIEPGKTRTIQVNVSCGAIEAESEFKKIGVKITDTAINKTWDDSVSVKFYKETVDFNIRANSGSSVSGVLIAPQGVYPFKNISWGQPITVPRSTEDYLLVFSGATAETETIYSFGIDVPAIESFAGFMDLMNYEPNNTEETATPVTQFQIVSYVHKNDIDYYRINLDYPPNIPTDLTVTEISNTSVALSWPAVLGATSYKVYRGSSASNGTVIASVSETAGSYYNYDTGAYDAYAYTDTGLSPNTTYHYRVTAVYNNNESDQSVYTTATTSNVVPEVTKVSNTSITLSWPAGIGLGATSYKVY
ncbi:MAG: fibronectin type III domain-containing protein, partial [Treponema sp.]|nr:fibronectin type III domain-containing protein [Treponema sp.]